MRLSQLSCLALASCVLSLGVGCKKPQTTGADAGPVDAAPPPPKVLESCDQVESLGVCIDYTKTDIGLHRTLCEGYKGKFQEKPCGDDKVLGTCALEDGEFKRYYHRAPAAGQKPETPEEAEKKAKDNCESELLKGKFTSAKK